ncbi:hypothetical protein PUN28_005598 [Cardiocondyla obscurior]|uniref:Secreted protein n=1 Tax=Cardiocondyla obscurior TaxID=286306 RepID=A0AAW2GKM2_9HYME
MYTTFLFLLAAATKSNIVLIAREFSLKIANGNNFFSPSNQSPRFIESKEKVPRRETNREQCARPTRRWACQSLGFGSRHRRCKGEIQNLPPNHTARTDQLSC